MNCKWPFAKASVGGALTTGMESHIGEGRV